MTETTDSSYIHDASRINVQELDIPAIEDRVRPRTHRGKFINPLTPNDPYRGRTKPLTSKRCILYIYSTNIGTEFSKHGIYSPPT